MIPADYAEQILRRARRRRLIQAVTDVLAWPWRRAAAALAPHRAEIIRQLQAIALAFALVAIIALSHTVLPGA